MKPAKLLTRIFSALFASLLLVACAAPHGSHAPILLDGDIGEWNYDEIARVDSRYLYLRFSTGDEFSLQAAPRTVAIYLDADADAETGERPRNESLADFGVDLAIEFSPRRANAPARGVSVWAASAAAREPINPAHLDLVVAPTYAASWYELRIALASLCSLIPGNPPSGTRQIRGFVATLTDDAAIDAWADPFTVTAPARPQHPGRSAATIPQPEAGDLRVVSWNVERSAPLRNPEPFRRILRALRPDILLLQEWDEGDADAVRAWLSDGGFPDWHVLKAEGDLATGGGVLVASRFALTPISGKLALASGTPVRFAAGIIQTPLGPLAACSTHLKCCGSKDSPEDRRRMEEARAINALLKSALTVDAAPLRLIAGDLNLVGSRPPLDLLRAELDTDATDLAVADATVLADSCFTTWRDPDTPFPPGRLDYLVYSDATLRAVRAFTLDTARLSDAALAASELVPADSWCSDHLPVVVDFSRAE